MLNLRGWIRRILVRHRFPWAGGLLAILLVGAIAPLNQALEVRVERWLEIQTLSGTVTYQQGQQSQSARVGMRLQSVGDGISTGAGSQATLAVDTGIGFVEVSERTVLRVQSLQHLADGGRITRLQIPSGQARLRVRTFTHPSSELEIETPAGWSAVRGTDFGLTVHPDGKMGVATLEGQVETLAQGQTVAVDQGFQNLTIPGEPPSSPVPLDEEGDTRLQLQELTTTDDGNARIMGRIDPVNLLILEDIPQTIASDGRFDLTVPLPANRRITVRVITPLGNRQVYELAIP